MAIAPLVVLGGKWPVTVSPQIVAGRASMSNKIRRTPTRALWVMPPGVPPEVEYSRGMFADTRDAHGYALGDAGDRVAPKDGAVFRRLAEVPGLAGGYFWCPRVCKWDRENPSVRLKGSIQPVAPFHKTSLGRFVRRAMHSKADFNMSARITMTPHQPLENNRNQQDTVAGTLADVSCGSGRKSTDLAPFWRNLCDRTFSGDSVA